MVWTQEGGLFTNLIKKNVGGEADIRKQAGLLGCGWYSHAVRASGQAFLRVNFDFSRIKLFVKLSNIGVVL